MIRVLKSMGVVYMVMGGFESEDSERERESVRGVCGIV